MTFPPGMAPPVSGPRGCLLGVSLPSASDLPPRPAPAAGIPAVLQTGGVPPDHQLFRLKSKQSRRGRSDRGSAGRKTPARRWPEILTAQTGQIRAMQSTRPPSLDRQRTSVVPVSTCLPRRRPPRALAGKKVERMPPGIRGQQKVSSRKNKPPQVCHSSNLPGKTIDAGSVRRQERRKARGPTRGGYRSAGRPP